MPQQSMFNTYQPAMTSITIELVSHDLDRLDDALTVAVRIGHSKGDPSTILRTTLRGVECDFVNTLVSEATSAFLYQETWRDVMMAMKGVLRQAKAHRKAHESGR